jgi:hypothetical protein
VHVPQVFSCSPAAITETEVLHQVSKHIKIPCADSPVLHLPYSILHSGRALVLPPWRNQQLATDDMRDSPDGSKQVHK